MNKDMLHELVKLAREIQEKRWPYDPTQWFTIRDGKLVAADLGGWACTHEPFKALGLRMSTVYNRTTKELVYAEPAVGKHHVCMGAMALVFDLSEDQVSYIFGSDDFKILTLQGNGPPVNYSLEAVISRIEQVIAGDIAMDDPVDSSVDSSVDE